MAIMANSKLDRKEKERQEHIPEYSVFVVNCAGMAVLPVKGWKGREGREANKT